MSATPRISQRAALRLALTGTVSRGVLDHMNRALVWSGRLGGLYTPVLDAADARTRKIIEQTVERAVRTPERPKIVTPEASKIVRAAGDREVQLEALKKQAMDAAMAAIDQAQKKPN